MFGYLVTNNSSDAHYCRRQLKSTAQLMAGRSLTMKMTERSGWRLKKTAGGEPWRMPTWMTAYPSPRYASPISHALQHQA